jgi:hypothetical protein
MAARTFGRTPAFNFSELNQNPQMLYSSNVEPQGIIGRGLIGDSADQRSMAICFSLCEMIPDVPARDGSATQDTQTTTF